MNKIVCLNTETINLILEGIINTFAIPIETKKIKTETIVSYYHPIFTTFDTSYHTRFNIKHPFEEGNIITLKEKRKDKNLLIKITKLEVIRLHNLPRDRYTQYKQSWDFINKKDYKFESNPFVYHCSFEIYKEK